MFINPSDLEDDLDRLEAIEKASTRLVTQAIYDFRETAAYIFHAEKDLVADIGEDITREALDRIGVSKIDERLFGKIDYKRARYVFHPEYAIRQALLVDSKAEKEEATATIQTAQTSMRIRHIRSGRTTDIEGKLPTVIRTRSANYLTTTIFVKYSYKVSEQNKLVNITIAGLPNGMLQERYNPNAEDTIWRAGRNAPTRGERFRVRLVFDRLKTKMNWRVQVIPMSPEPFHWND
jgi:hypothetical protein